MSSVCRSGVRRPKTAYVTTTWLTHHRTQNTITTSSGVRGPSSPSGMSNATMITSGTSGMTVVA